MIKHQRFELLLNTRESLLDGWKQSRDQFLKWREKFGTTLQKLQAKGEQASAEWIAGTLLRDLASLDAARFEVQAVTGNGTEIFTISGQLLGTTTLHAFRALIRGRTCNGLIDRSVRCPNVSPVRLAEAYELAI